MILVSRNHGQFGKDEEFTRQTLVCFTHRGISSDPPWIPTNAGSPNPVNDGEYKETCATSMYFKFWNHGMATTQIEQDFTSSLAGIDFSILLGVAM